MKRRVVKPASNKESEKTKETNKEMDVGKDTNKRKRKD